MTAKRARELVVGAELQTREHWKEEAEQWKRRCTVALDRGAGDSIEASTLRQALEKTVEALASVTKTRDCDCTVQSGCVWAKSRAAIVQAKRALEVKLDAST